MNELLLRNRELLTARQLWSQRTGRPSLHVFLKAPLTETHPSTCVLGPADQTERSPDDSGGDDIR